MVDRGFFQDSLFSLKNEPEARSGGTSPSLLSEFRFEGKDSKWESGEPAFGFSTFHAQTWVVGVVWSPACVCADESRDRQLNQSSVENRDEKRCTRKRGCSGPGVDTLNSVHDPAEKVKPFGENTAFERPAQPVETAPVFVFLASNEARFVSGEIYGSPAGGHRISGISAVIHSNMQTILITGGAGYIGSTTAHLLARRGYRVVVVDDLSRGHHRHNVQDFPFHQLSVLDTADLAAVLSRERVEAVVHFAAYIAVGESVEKPEMYFSNNLGGSLSLCNAVAQASVKQIVFSSTAAVYGIPEIVPVPETAPLAPINPYGESKLAVERLLSWLDQYSGLRSIALRYFNACGSDMQAGVVEEHVPETHLIPLLLEAVRTGQPLAVFGDDYNTPDGTCIRDYIHVADLAEAHVVALEHLLSGGRSDVFNVGTGTGHSVKELIQAVEAVTGEKVPFKIGSRRPGDPAVLVADSAKLKQTLHWTSRITALSEIISTAWLHEKIHTQRG